MLRTGVLTKIKRRADRVRSKAKPVKATPCVVIGSLYLTQRTETAGERYAITLTRGSKCVSTRAVSPQDGIVRFDEVFSLPCTLYRKADGESASSRGTANFEEKHYEVRLQRLQAAAGEMGTGATTSAAATAGTDSSAGDDGEPWLVASGQIDVAAATLHPQADVQPSSGAPAMDAQPSSTTISAQFSTGSLGLAFARHNAQQGALIVHRVHAGGQAEKLGIRIGDHIVALAGTPSVTGAGYGRRV